MEGNREWEHYELIDMIINLSIEWGECKSMSEVLPLAERMLTYKNMLVSRIYKLEDENRELKRKLDQFYDTIK